MSASTPDDERLRATWDDFCSRLREAGEIVFRDTAPATPLDRATGLRYVARYVTKALHQKLEFDDPEHPQLWMLQTPTHKSFGDNPDCTYHVASIDGSRNYRVVGNRGSVKWVSFMVMGEAVNNSDLVVEWDGGFQVSVGPDERPTNWIRTAPGPAQLMVRQFFGDWATEAPMRLRIELADDPGAPPSPLTPDRLITGLDAAIGWLIEDTNRWADWIDFYRDHPNEFVTGMPDWTSGGAESTLGRLLHFCYWKVQPDEALVIRVVPPPCAYWNFELGNYWMNSADYRYRLSSLNSEQAVLEDDGSLVVVVSHIDPRVPNWLDTAGHTVGLMPQRWVEATESPTPSVDLVPVEQLDELLGSTVHRISADERRRQQQLRKVGVDRRFQM
jgi:hypothetical protein